MISEDDLEKDRADFNWAALVKFCDTRPNVLANRYMTDRITRAYYSHLRSYMRPMMKGDTLADAHKMISLTEYTVLSHFPLRIKGEAGLTRDEARKDEVLLEINAQFALFLAAETLERHLINRLGLSYKPLMGRKRFLQEHRKWLKNIPVGNIREFPIFLNAQLWYAMEEICVIEQTGMSLEQWIASLPKNNSKQ